MLIDCAKNGYNKIFLKKLESFFNKLYHCIYNKNFESIFFDDSIKSYFLPSISKFIFLKLVTLINTSGIKQMTNTEKTENPFV